MIDDDVKRLAAGDHAGLWHVLGGRLSPTGKGARFGVWAPAAEAVSVVGDWNGWQPDADMLHRRSDHSGLWEGEAAGATLGAAYKYRVVSHGGSFIAEKADPLARACELPPATASRLWSGAHRWADDAWMRARAERNAPDAPMSIYEVHAGSWRRNRAGEFLGYRELAPALADHVIALGFTHLQLMPLTEHPFYGSWGYQTTGYFAPTARYGTPEDFKYFVDYMHGRGIAVILDWVPSHFPTDAHGLQYFDGTHLYEHADPRQGFHPEWNSSIFNYGRHEVRSFLLSSALYWLTEFHLDGLRVDGVASMLYLDYARKPGGWIPNRFGGHENLEAVDFVRALNQAVHRDCPGAVVIAEESTAWPGVSRPVETGGLGFDMKWNMGWMHDGLAYFAHDPIHRKHHQGELTFSMAYAFDENFVLALSHDEVVHGKHSLLEKMPGDDWQRFANLRALYGWMWAHPGKKLLFMGGEFAQRREWAHDGQLDWPLLELPAHAGVQRLIADLNRIYREAPALHATDFSRAGFEWVAFDDAQASVIAFIRQAEGSPSVLVVCNLTPVPRHDYRLGVPHAGHWREAINTDAIDYGGSGIGNLGGVAAALEPSHGRAQSVVLSLPPLAVVMLVHDESEGDT